MKSENGGYGQSYGNGGGGYGGAVQNQGNNGGGGGADINKIMEQIQSLQKTVMQLQSGGGGGGGAPPAPSGGNFNASSGGNFNASSGGNFNSGNSYGGDGAPSSMNWPAGSGYGNYGAQAQGGYGGAQGGYGGQQGGGYGGGAGGYGGGGYGGASNNGGGYPKSDNKPTLGSGQRAKVPEGEEVPSEQQRILLVSNIPPNLANPDSLYNGFEKFGTVERVKVLHNKRNTALIQMSAPSEAQRAVDGQQGLNARAGTEIYVHYSTKFREVSLPQPGTNTDDGLTKDFTGAYPQMRQTPMGGGMSGGMGGMGMGGGYGQGMDGSMYGPGNGGYPPMMNMSVGDGMDGGRGQVVLLVSNLPDSVANVNSIFNLLGVYGDVLCVKILHNKRDCALVQMAKPHQAQQVRRYLGNAKLGGNKLCISNSRMNSLLDKRLIEDEGLQADFSNSRCHRFRKQQQAEKIQKNLGPPTNVLHVANIPEGYTHQEVKELFISRGFTVSESSEISGKSNMCYLQMPSPDEALSALASMHNYTQDGLTFKAANGLCVSFSKMNAQTQQE